MAIRVFGSAMFKITSEKILDKDVIGGGQSNEYLHFNDYLRSAEIFFPTRNKLCLVQYREFQVLTASGIGSFVSIEATPPIKFCAMELGPCAQLLCEEALCRHVEKVYFSKIYTGLEMATRTFAESICIINKRYDYKTEDVEGFYITSRGVIATITSPLLNENITVLYDISKKLSHLGVEAYAKIKVTQPIELEITAYGLDSQLRCNQALCREIENVYLKKTAV